MAAMVQGSPAWFEARLGRVTASRVAEVIGRTAKGTWTAERARYRAQLVAERLTGQVAHHYVSVEMMWGTDHEPHARAAYEFLFDRPVVQVGFVDHPTIAMAGASPDGLIGADGLVEFKCPKTETHLATWLSGAVPEEYLPQVQWQMACTRRAWCDFVSFDPRVPTDLQLFCTRVARDEAMIAGLEQDVAGFLAEVDAQVAQLLALGQRRAA
ncbi:lambda exonuclease family protein [Methylobacterium nodulans]|uniref:Phage-type endonuclease n=1 Tax=Methylobacterium nodulans (strain LMG 21967 / CNCM I-2342 / ORS 2060) TaxID=460265 RepID=B8IRI3_METNO|nr:lambda exonuclease family protein [Methylobacterium nodulans]ACL58723.1 phage-type endonuclease [Methylobacterium nodulans ORS 2060]